MTSARSQLIDGALALGVVLADEQANQLLDYLALLAKWNQTYRLTAITAKHLDVANVMVSHHLLDSLAVLPHFAAWQPAEKQSDQTFRIADVGSGGGQPGIPLAIARPDWHVTLVDSSQKKTAFLQQVVIALGLHNVAVVTGRVEQIHPTEPYHVVTSRAFAALADFVQLTRHWLTQGNSNMPRGRWAALKGAAPDAEIGALPKNVQLVDRVPLQVPELAEARHLVWLAPQDTLGL